MYLCLERFLSDKNYILCMYSYYAIQMCEPNSLYFCAPCRLESAEICISAGRYTNVNRIVVRTFKYCQENFKPKFTLIYIKS